MASLVGQAGNFRTATNSEVVITAPTGLSFGNGVTDQSFSITFIINLASLVGLHMILNKRGVANSALNEYRMYFTAGKFYVQLFDNTFANNISINTAVSLSIDTNYHITVTYNGDGTGDGLELYLDGVLQTSLTAGGGTYVAMHDLGTELVLGKNSFNTGNPLNAYADCLRFWSRKLNSSQITLIATDELAGIDINP